MPIRVLPTNVASKIAAGEVVERPASVAKELVENAIDAGATDIRIEIRQGGRRLIRVSDNGCGIAHDEAPVAFEHHATSKITSEADLARIMTLGFRGEALASIAAVSQVTMLTRVGHEAAGTLLRLDGGDLVRYERQGASPGTVLTVENLFFNTPARLKFLRAEATEGSHIVKLVSAYAMAYPELHFALVHNGRLSLQSSGSGKLYDVLIKVFGLETAQQLLELNTETRDLEIDVVQKSEGIPRRSGAVTVQGYVSVPSLHRSTRGSQVLFVNRRWIRDHSLTYALEEAYRTLIPTGRHPIAVLSITMNTSELDVNVHPTKREVRFQDPRGVFAAVQRSVRHTVVGQAPVASFRARPAATLSGGWQRQRELPRDRLRTEIGSSPGEIGLEVQRTADTEPPSIPCAPMLARLPMLRVLGQVRQMYIIAEGPDGLYLIDQHAAHERVLYEQLQQEQAKMLVSSQALLEPLTIELLPQQRGLLEPVMESLASFGFDISPFGGDTYLIRAIPGTLSPAQAPEVLADLLDSAGEGLPVNASAEQTLYTIVCHSAIRAGQTLTLDEARELIHQLEKTTAPYTCPHGRPTMIHLSSTQLERSFGRR